MNSNVPVSFSCTQNTMNYPFRNLKSSLPDLDPVLFADLPSTMLFLGHHFSSHLPLLPQYANHYYLFSLGAL